MFNIFRKKDKIINLIQKDNFILMQDKKVAKIVDEKIIFIKDLPEGKYNLDSKKTYKLKNKKKV